MNKALCLSCFGIFTCPSGSCTDITPETPVERWALKNAKKASAEEIIVAAVVQSFAKHFDDWTSVNFSDPQDAYDYSPDGLGTLVNKKKHVTITREAQRKGDKYRFVPVVTINDVVVSPALSKLLVTHWEKVFLQVLKTKSIAEQAKNEMDVTQKAWNIAENLLNMERTPSGALIPKEPVK